MREKEDLFFLNQKLKKKKKINCEHVINQRVVPLFFFPSKILTNYTQ